MMKLSVLFRLLLRHITVDESLIIILDVVTCRVEVKLAFRVTPLTSMREILSGPRFKILGGVSVAKYEVGWVISGLRHSRANEPYTRQVNVTCCPGQVKRSVLFEVSSTLPTMIKMRYLGDIFTSNYRFCVYIHSQVIKVFTSLCVKYYEQDPLLQCQNQG